MSKREAIASVQDSRPLDKVQLDKVSGGFGFVERGFVIYGSQSYDPPKGVFFLKNTNAP
jgi:hypothetical protein